MSITYFENNGIISIDTKSSTYQMRIGQHGFLQHLYYGSRIGHEDMSYLYRD